MHSQKIDITRHGQPAMSLIRAGVHPDMLAAIDEFNSTLADIQASRDTEQVVSRDGDFDALDPQEIARRITVARNAGQAERDAHDKLFATLDRVYDVWQKDATTKRDKALDKIQKLAAQLVDTLDEYEVYGGTAQGLIEHARFQLRAPQGLQVARNTQQSLRDLLAALAPQEAP